MDNYNDLINAAFEFCGFIAVIPTIIEANRTKEIKGVSIITVLFFASWGFWNVFYYPSLNQEWSAYAAILLAAVNCVWLWQVYQYSYKKRGVL